jgi:hypothetical protein
MKFCSILFFLGIILLPAFGQDSMPVNRLGLTVEYGIGSAAIVDEYISDGRYTGNLPYLGIWYNRLARDQGFRLGLTFQQDTDLENHSIQAELSRINLIYDQLFKVKKFNIAKKPAFWTLGPSFEYFEYELINQFSSTHKGFSEFIMVTLSFNTAVEWDFTKRFTASVFLRTNVIGTSFKTHDEQQYPDENTRLQTLFTANNLNMDLGLRYRLMPRISLGLKGKAQYTRSTGWNPSQMFVNSLLLYTIIHF